MAIIYITITGTDSLTDKPISDTFFFTGTVLAAQNEAVRRAQAISNASGNVGLRIHMVDCGTGDMYDGDAWTTRYVDPLTGEATDGGDLPKTGHVDLDDERSKTIRGYIMYDGGYTSSTKLVDQMSEAHGSATLDTFAPFVDDLSESICLAAHADKARGVRPMGSDTWPLTAIEANLVYMAASPWYRAGMTA